MRGAIAAGHPLTAAAGARVLADGGNAVDALLAAAFTAFVTEGPLTGPAGGGLLLVHEPGGATTLLDCFFAVPAERLGEMDEVVIDFEDAGTQTFHVGDGSVAVPGLLAGLEEAHGGHATRVWADLVEPALELAWGGSVDCDEPRVFLHGILAGILQRDEGGRAVYGDSARVRTETLCETLEDVRDSGAAAVTRLLPEYVGDLSSYRVAELEPIAIEACGGARVLTAPAPSRGGRVVAEILEMLSAASEPSLHDEARALQIAYGRSGAGLLTGTTHISVVDASGTAAALSSTLGSGSGVFRRGVQLNNMLGELDVIGHETRAPGTRLPTMLTPTLVLEDERPRLVLGSAGSVRLAGAIAQVAWRVLSSAAPVGEAIDAPRMHPEGSTLHLEGGWGDDEVYALHEEFDVVRWSSRNLFFGGVQAVELAADGSLAAAGDPRRGGAGVVVE
jgi:gamma-glutamyltranspeptidase/glutathione hydrolase